MRNLHHLFVFDDYPATCWLMSESQIPVVMYHGTPEERAELRRTVMRLEDSREKSSSEAQASHVPKTKKHKSKSKSGKQSNISTKGARRNGRFEPQLDDDEDSQEEEEDGKEKEDSDYVDSESEAVRIPPPSEPDTVMSDGAAIKDENDDDEEINTFPVVVTTYEMIIRDRVHLAQYKWGYVVVDEGHRLKNLDCKLMQEIKKYPSAGRMILTGTPLHVCCYTPFPCNAKVHSSPFHRTI